LSDYGRSIMAGFAGMGAGMGWLVQKLGQASQVDMIADLGEGLKEAGQRASEAWLTEKLDAVGITSDGLSENARRAMQVEFLGEGRFGDKFNKALLMAAQSLPATGAGMGAGGIIARGLTRLG